MAIDIVTTRSLGAERAPDPAQPTARAHWSAGRRIGFRFVLTYVVLFFFPLPSGLSDPEWLSGSLDPAWHRLVAWVAEHALHRSLPGFSNGSGDTTYDYLRVLCMLVIAALVTLAWSLLDRRRTEYATLHAWARVWLRYAIAASMLTYGVSKLFHGQFYDPSDNVLATPVGQMSPQRLLWTVIGVSKGYEAFGGAGEVIGGLLLLFRRTALLGALILVGVVSNVVALNLCYDVCVKLGSIHLLLAAALLAAPDASRLGRLFLLDRPVPASDPGVRFTRPYLQKGAYAVRTVLIGAFLVGLIGPRLGHDAPPPTYTVSTFSLDGTELATADARRWTAFAVGARGVKIQRGDAVTYFRIRGDRKRGPITLFEVDDGFELVPGAGPVGELRVAEEPPGHATVDGTFRGSPVHATMYAPDRAQLRLLRTGFHWIHEAPDSEPR